MNCKRVPSRLPTLVLALLLGLVTSSHSTNAPALKPNVLWLIAEDLGPELACYGTREVFTPNLDRLAREGVRYTGCYSGMVCSPSRSAFMTGMYATSIGAHQHRTPNKKPLPPGVRLITEWMRDAGYFTANLVQLPPGCGFKGSGKTDWNFLPAAKPFDTRDWSDLQTNQPFFAQLNFKEAHRPYGAPRKADPAKVEIPPYYPDHPVTRRDWADYLDDISELDRKVGLVLNQLETDGLAANTVVMFFGDNGQSMVRGKQFCYEEGLHVPLIIRWPKGIPPPAGFQPGTVDSRLLEAIDFAPTILSLVGAPRPSRMQGRIFLGENSEPPKQYAFGARDRCDETAMRIRAVRDGRYRYIRNFTPEVPFLAPNAYKEKQYPVWNLLQELHAQGKLTPVQEVLCQPRMPDEELYDLQMDRWQITNLVASTRSEHRTALAKLRAALEQWIEETNDLGRLSENPAPASQPGREGSTGSPPSPRKGKQKSNTPSQGKGGNP